MRAVDQIGHGLPDTLPAAHAEIRRLRELARDWLAFGGEFGHACDLRHVSILADKLCTLARTDVERHRSRPAARLLLAMSQKPKWLWSKEVLLQQCLSLRTAGYDGDDDEKSLVQVNVLVCYARVFLKLMCHSKGIETVWAQGYLIKADAAAAVLQLAGVTQGGRA